MASFFSSIRDVHSLIIEQIILERYGIIVPADPMYDTVYTVNADDILNVQNMRLVSRYIKGLTGRALVQALRGTEKASFRLNICDHRTRDATNFNSPLAPGLYPIPDCLLGQAHRFEIMIPFFFTCDGYEPFYSILKALSVEMMRDLSGVWEVRTSEWSTVLYSGQNARDLQSAHDIELANGFQQEAYNRSMACLRNRISGNITCAALRSLVNDIRMIPFNISATTTINGSWIIHPFPSAVRMYSIQEKYPKEEARGLFARFL